MGQPSSACETLVPARKTQKRPQGDLELLGWEAGKAFSLSFFFNEVAYSVTI